MAVVRNAAGTAVSNSTTTITPSFPTNAVGDILLMSVATQSTISSISDASFVLIGSDTSQATRTYLYWAYVSSVKSGSVTITTAGNNSGKAVIVSYSGASPNQPPASAITTGGTATSSTTHTAPLAGDQSAYAVAIFGRVGTSNLSAESASPGTWTASEAAEITGSASLTHVDGPLSGGTSSTIATGTSSLSTNYSYVTVMLAEPANVISQNWDGGTGAASGTQISAANTNGAGNTPIGTYSGTAFAFSNAQVHSNSLSVLYNLGASATSSVDWTVAPALQKRQVVREYFYFTALPTQTTYLNSIRVSAGALAANILVNASGKLEHRNQANTAVWTATNTIPLNTWIRVEWAITQDTTTTGIGEVAYFLGDSTTPIETSGLLTGNNYTATPATIMRLGSATAVGNAVTYYRDDFAYSDNMYTGWFGPATVAPTVYTTTGTLAADSGLTGTAFTVKTTTGSTPVNAQMVGSVTGGTRITTGSTPVNAAMSAATTGVFPTTGSTPANAALTGSPSLVASLTGALPANAAMTGTAFIVLPTSGSTPANAAMTGTASTVKATTGQLAANAALTPSAFTIKATTGQTPANAALNNSVYTVKTTTGSLPVNAALNNTVSSIRPTTGSFPVGVAPATPYLSLIARLTGALSVTAGFTAPLSGMYSIRPTTGTLPANAQLASAVKTVKTTTSQFAGVNVGLVATYTGQVRTTTGSLPLTVAPTGSAYVFRRLTTTGTLPINAALTNAVTSIRRTTGTFPIGAAFTATVTKATALATGQLRVTAALTSTVRTIKAITGTLAATVGLTATNVKATPILRQTLAVTVGLVGTARTVKTTTGALGLTAAFTSKVATVKTTTGTLPLSIAVNGLAQTIQRTSGRLSANANLLGSPESVRTVTGTLKVTAVLTGSARTVKTTSGALAIAVALTSRVSTAKAVSGSLPATVALRDYNDPQVAGTLRITAGLVATSTRTVKTTTGRLPIDARLSNVVRSVKPTTSSLPILVGLAAGTTSTVKTVTGALPITVAPRAKAYSVRAVAGSLPIAAVFTAVKSFTVKATSGALRVAAAFVSTARIFSSSPRGSLPVQVGLVATQTSSQPVGHTTGVLRIDVQLKAQSASIVRVTSGRLDAAIRLTAISGRVLTTTGTLPITASLNSTSRQVVVATAVFAVMVGLQATSTTQGPPNRDMEVEGEVLDRRWSGLLIDKSYRSPRKRWI